MRKDNISTVMNNIDTKYIQEAEFYVAKKNKKGKTFWRQVPAAACLLICLLLGTGAYAAYEAFDWSSFIRFENGSQVAVVEKAEFKKISASAPKTNENQGLEMSHSEVENALGLKLLNYPEVTSDVIYYTTLQNEDGTIGRVDLWWPEFLKANDEKHMTLSIAMLNKGADEGYVLAFEEGLNAAGGKSLKRVIQDGDLGTEMIVYTDGSFENKICISFVHDSIFYQFAGFDYTEEEMLEIIRDMN